MAGDVEKRYVLKRGEKPKEGGQSQVWRAMDLELKREVAVKRLKTELIDSPAARRRFDREAEIIARLDHPGVVPIYGFGEFGSRWPYYAMRYVEGESLQEYIDREFQRLTESSAPGRSWLSAFRTQTLKVDADWVREVISRLIEVCHTIEYAHSRGVLHRDLKPANIMLGRFGEVVVIDWGIAKRFTTNTCTASPSTPVACDGDSGTRVVIDIEDAERMDRTGSISGTFGYMSPEQLSPGRPLDPRTDVYGLGATLYTVLCGQPPFKLTRDDSSGSTEAMKKLAVELCERIAAGHAIRPRARVRGVDSQLEAVCLKAMSQDPASRYQTAALLRADLERWLRGDPVKARRQTLGEWLVGIDRRHRGRLMASSLAMTVAAALGWGLYISDQHRRSEASWYDHAHGSLDRVIDLLVGGLLDQPRAEVRAEFLDTTRKYLNEVSTGRNRFDLWGRDPRAASDLVKAAYFLARLEDLRETRAKAVDQYTKSIRTVEDVRDARPGEPRSPPHPGRTVPRARSCLRRPERPGPGGARLRGGPQAPHRADAKPRRAR